MAFAPYQAASGHVLHNRAVVIESDHDCAKDMKNIDRSVGPGKGTANMPKDVEGEAEMEVEMEMEMDTEMDVDEGPKNDANAFNGTAGKRKPAEDEMTDEGDAQEEEEWKREQRVVMAKPGPGHWLSSVRFLDVATVGSVLWW